MRFNLYTTVLENPHSSCASHTRWPHSQHVWRPMCVGFPLTKQCSDTSRGSYNSTPSDTTWRQRQSPQVKGSVPQDCPTPLPSQTPIASPGCHLCFWPTSYRLVVPTTHSLGSVSLLEQLTELRETFYSLDHWCIVKGYNSGAARCKQRIGQGMGEGKGTVSMFSVHRSSRISTCSPWKPVNPILLGFYGGFTTQAWWNHWPLVNRFNLPLLSLPLEIWGWTESSNTLITWLVPLEAAPILRLPTGFPKVTPLT